MRRSKGAFRWMSGTSPSPTKTGFWRYPCEIRFRQRLREITRGEGLGTAKSQGQPSHLYAQGKHGADIDSRSRQQGAYAGASSPLDEGRGHRGKRTLGRGVRLRLPPPPMFHLL